MEIRTATAREKRTFARNYQLFIPGFLIMVAIVGLLLAATTNIGFMMAAIAGAAALGYILVILQRPGLFWSMRRYWMSRSGSVFFVEMSSEAFLTLSADRGLDIDPRVVRKTAGGVLVGTQDNSSFLEQMAASGDPSLVGNLDVEENWLEGLALVTSSIIMEFDPDSANLAAEHLRKRDGEQASSAIQEIALKMAARSAIVVKESAVRGKVLATEAEKLRSIAARLPP